MKSSRCFVLCFFVILSSHFNNILSQQKEISEEEFYFDRDGDKSIILANHSIIIIQTNSIFRCSWSCVKFKECVSLNFSPTEGFCQLNDAVAAEYPQDVQPQDDHWYFELRGKLLQQIDLSFTTMATTPVLFASEEMTTTKLAKPGSTTLTSTRTTFETRAATTVDKTTSKVTTLKTNPDTTTNEMSTVGSTTKKESTEISTTEERTTEKATVAPTSTVFTTDKTTKLPTTRVKTTEKTTQRPTTIALTTGKTTRLPTTVVKTTEKTTQRPTTTDLTTDKTTTGAITTDSTTDQTTVRTTTEESTVITTQPTTILTTVITTEKTTTLPTTETIGGEDTTLSYQVRGECYAYLYYATANPVNGVYKIQTSIGTFPVYCNLLDDGGGWTLIQRRIDNSVSFDRDWNAYQNGFGGLNSNFWLGLDKISSICNARDCEMVVVMTDWADVQRISYYGGFSVEGTDLYVGSFISGASGNSLPLAVLVPFSTSDADNDASGSNCASTHGGGWWYTDCGNASPNGYYYPSNDNMHSDGIIWQSWQGATYSLKSMELRVRNTANV